MGNLLRMDLYRLVRSKSFYLCLGIICAFCALGCFTLWISNTPEYVAAQNRVENAQTGEPGLSFEEGTAQENYSVGITEPTVSIQEAIPLQEFLGGIVVNSGGLVFLLALALALFISSEYESGFIKNVFTSSKGRGAYVASKIVLTIITTIVFLLATSLVSIVGIFVIGAELTFSPAEFFPWLLLVLLACTAYTMIVVFSVLLTKSKVVGILTACLITSGLLGMVLANILGLFPDSTFLLDYTMFANLRSLASGNLDSGLLSFAHIVAVTGIYFVVFSTLSFICTRKKDI